MAQGMLEIGAEREDGASLFKGLTTGGGQGKPPAYPVEQRYPEGELQLGHLTADGLRREVQLLGGPRHAPLRATCQK